MSDSPPEPGRPAAASEAAPEAAARGASALRAAVPAIVAAALAALVLAWQWHDHRREIGALRHEIAKRLSDTETQSKESRIIAEQVRAAVADAQVKVGVLESRLAESQSQQIALESLYQELSRNRDEWAYAEIEQSLFIASQQLALAGNVKGALIAMQAADARLQRMDRPQLTALRKAINRDIERLKAAPHVDTVAISARLDGLIGQVDKLPLSMEVRPQQEPEPSAGDDPEPGAWQRFWRDAWAEIKQLVRVQRIDQADVPLLAPAQTYFLRENLKLRLISARLALLSRDSASYKADLKSAREWLARYYDARNNHVAYAQGMLRNLHDAEVSIETPEISATLEAMRALRTARERAAR